MSAGVDLDLKIAPKSEAAFLASGHNGRADRILFVALLIASGVSYAGQSFQAWGWPAIDGYPAIERAIDPGFLTNDFYTNTTAQYGVDTNQAVVLAAVQRYFGVHYATVLAALTLIRCLAFPALVYWFFHAFTKRHDLALAGAILGALSNFALPKTVGWAWMWGDASTAMFAVAAILPAWSLFLMRKIWPCLFLFTAAAVIHPLMAVHAAVFLLLAFVLDYSAGERLQAIKSPPNLGAGLLFAAVFIVQYLALSGGRGDHLAADAFSQIIAHERHPGDYLPSRFPLSTAAAFALAILAAALMILRLWPTLARRQLLIGVLAAYAAMALGGWLFVEVQPVRFFIQLIPYRFAFVGAPMLLLVFAAFAVQAVRTRNDLAAFLILAAFFLAAPKLNAPFVLPAAFLVAAAIAPDWRFKAADPLVRKFLSGPEPAFAAIAALTIFGSAIGYARRAEFIIPQAANQHPVYAWVKANTGDGAVFLLDQNSRHGRQGEAINPQKMRLVGRRAVVASKDFPFGESDMQPWHERWVHVLESGAPDSIDKASSADLVALGDAFPFDYLVRREPLPEGSGFTLTIAFPAWHGVPPIYLYRSPQTINPSFR